MLLALSIASLLACPAQEDTESRPPLVSINELALVHFDPEHVDADSLADLAHQMVARAFYVQERGGYDSRPVSNISVLGDNLVLYDTEAYLKVMVAALQELDKPDSQPKRRETPPLSTLEYTPRYVSLQGLLNALDSFSRTVHDGRDHYNNIASARERGILVVREYADRLEEIRALLERIDVPEPQVQLTCHLIMGVQPEGDDDALPAELLSNLKKLVPGYSFVSLSFGLLQVAAVPERPIELQLEVSSTRSYQLNFNTSAYDSRKAALSVTRCRLAEIKSVAQEDGTRRTLSNDVFTTDTIFRGGEYTVLGASGQEPVFVVVRVTPIGKPN